MSRPSKTASVRRAYLRARFVRGERVGALCVGRDGLPEDRDELAGPEPVRLVEAEVLRARCEREEPGLPVGVPEEAVEHAVVARHRRRHADCAQALAVCLAPVAQQVDLRGDHERRRRRRERVIVREQR